jgi:hypothetical protein
LSAAAWVTGIVEARGTAEQIDTTQSGGAFFFAAASLTHLDPILKGL